MMVQREKCVKDERDGRGKTEEKNKVEYCLITFRERERERCAIDVMICKDRKVSDLV